MKRITLSWYNDPISKGAQPFSSTSFEDTEHGDQRVVVPARADWVRVVVEEVER